MKISYEYHIMIYNLYQNSNNMVWKDEKPRDQSQETLSPDRSNLEECYKLQTLSGESYDEKRNKIYWLHSDLRGKEGVDILSLNWRDKWNKSKHLKYRKERVLKIAANGWGEGKQGGCCIYTGQPANLAEICLMTMTLTSICKVPKGAPFVACCCRVSLTLESAL